MEERRPFIHESAICESPNIGPGTRVWAFAHILPKARLGADCNICDGVFIENDVVIGDRVTIKCGVQLWDGARIGDDVFIGPNATFTNDPFPRSKHCPEKFESVTIRDHASIGGNAVLLPGVTIGQHAMVGAGSVVTKDVPPFAIVVGNPARILSYCTTVPSPLGHAGERQMSIARSLGAMDETGCRIVDFKHHGDMRGDLAVFSLQNDIPFVLRRVFTVFNVPNNKVRGEHAHKRCIQMLVAVHGRLNVVVDNGSRRAEMVLDSPAKGLIIPGGVWGTQYNFSSDAVLSVYASEEYDPDDYIRDYDLFLKYVQSTLQQ